ncbi:hypothetical protein Cadr_000018108 [Camelus dromedarius]|uniref:Uncharacterized protein n=1 Tax=Camelus dromedarius TaxID=9838 RepID=A0A5N4D6M9_CAMDR|nr:hypothetical protein Cadr_000018108 [Camelus dromedarius]
MRTRRRERRGGRRRRKGGGSRRRRRGRRKGRGRKESGPVRARRERTRDRESERESERARANHRRAEGQPPRRGLGPEKPARFAHGVHVGPSLSAYVSTNNHGAHQAPTLAWQAAAPQISDLGGSWSLGARVQDPGLEAPCPSPKMPATLSPSKELGPHHCGDLKEGGEKEINEAVSEVPLQRRGCDTGPLSPREPGLLVLNPLTEAEKYLPKGKTGQDPLRRDPYLSPLGVSSSRPWAFSAHLRSSGRSFTAGPERALRLGHKNRHFIFSSRSLSLEEEAGEEGMKKGRGVGIVPRVGGEFLRVADTQGAGGRVNPASPLPVPATPPSGWGDPASPRRYGASPGGRLDSAEIENRRHSWRIEASGTEAQFGDTLLPRRGRLLPTRRTPPAWAAAVAWGCTAGRRAAAARRAALCAGPGPGPGTGAAGRAPSPGLSEPPRRAELRAAHRAHLAAPQLLAPLRFGPKHHARLPEPVKGGGAACPRRGWLDWLWAELGEQTPQGGYGAPEIPLLNSQALGVGEKVWEQQDLGFWGPGRLPYCSGDPNCWAARGPRARRGVLHPGSLREGRSGWIDQPEGHLNLSCPLAAQTLGSGIWRSYRPRTAVQVMGGERAFGLEDVLLPGPARHLFTNASPNPSSLSSTRRERKTRGLGHMHPLGLAQLHKASLSWGATPFRSPRHREAGAGAVARGLGLPASYKARRLAPAAKEGAGERSTQAGEAAKPFKDPDYFPLNEKQQQQQQLLPSRAPAPLSLRGPAL